MSKKITILGCGYLGRALAECSMKIGWEVTSFTRNPETAECLSQIGVQKVVVGNLQDSDWHTNLDPEQDYVVNCVGASAPSPEGYRLSYVQGLRSIKKWLKDDRKTKVIFTSSTSVYPQTDGELVDESSTNEGVSERGEILLEAEKVCLELNAEQRRSFVLRLAGLYGPGRHLLIDKVKRGEQLTGSGNRILNLIHRDDAVQAIIEILKHEDPITPGVFNVSDNEWATRNEIVEWIAKHLKLPSPGFQNHRPDSSPNRKVSSERIRKETGWSPVYSSFRQAYEEMLASQVPNSFNV